MILSSLELEILIQNSTLNPHIRKKLEKHLRQPSMTLKKRTLRNMLL